MKKENLLKSLHCIIYRTKMKIQLDKEADAAYFFIKNKIKKGEVFKTISLDKSINVDLDRKSRILGIEILNVSKTLAKPFSLSNKTIRLV